MCLLYSYIQKQLELEAKVKDRNEVTGQDKMASGRLFLLLGFMTCFANEM